MDAKCVQCAAKCCGNKLLDRSDLTFFTFPENDKLAKIWANNSNLENYCSESTLCSEHFEDIYFDNKYGKKAVFKENTEPIPTIFNLHKESQIPGRIDNLLLSRLLSNNDTQLDFGNIGSYTDHFIQPNTSSINVCNNDKVKSDTNSQPLCSNKISVDYIYCRLCAKLLPDCKLHPIFGASNYNELLEMCLPGKFLATDEISHKICSPCIRKLEFCSSILKSFIEADTKLRNLQTHISTKINEPTTSHQSDAISKPSDELIVQEREQIQFQCIKCSAIFDHKEDMVVHAFHSHPTLRGSKIISNIITNKIGKDHLNQLKPKRDVQTPRNTTKRFQCIICMDILDTKEAVISHTLTNHKQLARDKILTKIIDLDHEKLKNQCKFIVKHMCISCPTIYESKQEVIEHASLIHPQNKIVSKTILIKRNDSIKTSSLPLAKTQKVNQPTKKFSYYGTKFKNKTTSFPANVNKINKTNSRRLRPNTESSEYTFQIKYQCRDCSILFNSYKEVLDHFDVLHLTLKESGIVASVVKVRDSISTVSNDEQNSDNKENLVDCLKNDDNIVCVNDGTIIEVDPNAKPEGRKKKTKIVTETRYKCLTCSKLFKHKKAMLQHSLLLHVKDVKPGLNEINCKAVKVKKEYNYRCYGKKERYECLICATHHLAKETLISHTRVFHPSISKDKFLCRFVTAKNIRSKDCLRCNTVIKNFNRYRLHIQKHVTFTCETCEMKFNKPGYLRNHLKIHQEPKIVETYKCLGCEEKFTSKIQKYIHEQIHKIPKVVSCSKCNKQFSSEFELKRHDKNYHAICLCDVCGKTYEVKYIRHHLETHNTNTPFKCKLCSRSFKTCGALSKHKKTHFPTNKNKTMCQICGKLFLHESIKLHMRIHTGERPEVCEICGAAFRRKDHLRNHKKTHMQDKIYQCLICHANLFSKQAYKTHMASTHDKFVVDSLIQSEKHFTCNICQKAFKQKINLEDHLRMHSGQRIYSCDICNKSFGTKLCVYQHKKTHLEYDQLPFKCEVCDKKFRRLENLRNHRRIHTGEKPFPCPICQRPFRVRGEMVKHMRIHKRTEERIKKKRSLEIVSVTDDSSQDVFSVQDSNSFEEFESSNMPSLE